MKKNVGTADRWIRIVIGLVLLSLVFFGPKTAWGWLGLIPLLTAFVGFCPLYLPFKISTRKEEGKSQPQ
ncbi:MAG: YgaP family membrane protein [Candidatus Kryptoniota bacterium]